MVNCWLGVSLPLSATAQSNAQAHYLKGTIQLSFLCLVCFYALYFLEMFRKLSLFTAECCLFASCSSVAYLTPGANTEESSSYLFITFF